MKKFIKTLILIICIVISSTSYVKADDNTCPITVQADPSYELILPQSISIPYTNSDTMECCINFGSILLEPGYGLDVTMEHDDFTNILNSSYKFPYTTDFSGTIITEKDTEICFKVYLDETSLSISPPGDYTSKITLTIKYVKL